MRFGRATLITAFVLLFLFAGLSEWQINTNAKKAYVTSCHRANEVRSGALQFITGSLIRSERANQATVDSKTSSREQKAAAQSTLDELSTIKRQAVDAFTPKDCTYPPP